MKKRNRQMLRSELYSEIGIDDQLTKRIRNVAEFELEKRIEHRSTWHYRNVAIVCAFLVVVVATSFSILSEDAVAPEESIYSELADLNTVFDAMELAFNELENLEESASLNEINESLDYYLEN